MTSRRKAANRLAITSPRGSADSIRCTLVLHAVRSVARGIDPD